MGPRGADGGALLRRHQPLDRRRLCGGLRAQSAARRARDRLGASGAPRAPRSPMRASSRSPTACSGATAAWCGRSRPSARPTPPRKANRSGWISTKSTGLRTGTGFRYLACRAVSMCRARAAGGEPWMKSVLLLLGILVVLAFPVIAIVALVIALNARTDAATCMRERLDALDAETAGRAPAPAAAARLAPPPPVIEAPPRSRHPAAATSCPAAEPQPPRSRASAAAPPRPGASAGLCHAGRTFGTQWVVWIGGLALALGGIFLVRYSIEQGLIGPGRAHLPRRAVRGAADRRRRMGAAQGNQPPASPPFPTRHIPSILTAAGTIAAYATVYAAYALYGFLAPGRRLRPARPGGAGDAGRGAAARAGARRPRPGRRLRHAAAGLDGRAELLGALCLSRRRHAAAFALARMRLWRWLAITAVVFGALWTLAGHRLSACRCARRAPLPCHCRLRAGGGADRLRPALWPAGRTAARSTGFPPALSAPICSPRCVVLGSAHDPAALTVFTAARGGDGRHRLAHRGRALGAAGGRLRCRRLVMLHWARRTTFDTLMLPRRRHRAAPFPVRRPASDRIWRSARPSPRCSASRVMPRKAAPRIRSSRCCGARPRSATPIAILIALYLRVARIRPLDPVCRPRAAARRALRLCHRAVEPREPRPGMAALGGDLRDRRGRRAGAGLTFALEKGWLTVGAGADGARHRLDRRTAAAAGAALLLAAGVVVWCCCAIGYEPRIVGTTSAPRRSSTGCCTATACRPLSFWYAGYLLRRRADDVPARMADSAAILFTVLLAFLEIRHYMNNGDIFRRLRPRWRKSRMQVAVGLAMTIGLERLRVRTQQHRARCRRAGDRRRA